VRESAAAFKGMKIVVTLQVSQDCQLDNLGQLPGGLNYAISLQYFS